jgi:hypothetical protein
MQQDNSILNKLQQLENQQLPDLSQMDAHWRQMEPLLAAGAPLQKAGGKTWRWWVPAALLIVATAWWALRNTQQSAATGPAPATAAAVQAPAANDTLPQAKWTISGDTLKLVQQVPIRHTGMHNRQHNSGGQTMALPRTDTQYFNINFIPCKDSGSTATLRQQWLGDLFAQLQKEPAHFTVDNRKDTALLCPEGTVVQIPAGSLGGHTGILFTVKEIYKKSDMVRNQLSATSHKALLESGGMLRLTATVNGQAVDVAPNRPIRVYMADTSSYMAQMQLFTGEKTTDRLPSAIIRFNDKLEDVTNGPTSTYMNWIPQYVNFARPFVESPETEVKVLDLRNEPLRTRENRQGTVGIFAMAPDAAIDRKALKAQLKEKYGYAKVKLRKGRGFLGLRRFKGDGNGLGDSAWVPKSTANRYGLAFAETRALSYNNGLNPIGRSYVPIGKRNTQVYYSYDTSSSMQSASRTLHEKVKEKYGVDIRQLGWINCDRFYNDPREKIEYVVQLGDTASNYYTMLIFDKLNATLNGYTYGTNAMFRGLPADEPVTIVSIGINNKGQAVYAIQKAIANKAGLTGITFQPADALPNALSQLDR